MPTKRSQCKAANRALMHKHLFTVVRRTCHLAIWHLKTAKIIRINSATSAEKLYLVVVDLSPTVSVWHIYGILDCRSLMKTGFPMYLATIAEKL